MHAALHDFLSYTNKLEGIHIKIRSIKTILGCVLMTAACTSSYMTLTNYLVPLSLMLNASVGEISLIFTYSGLAGLVCSLALGKLIKLLKVRVLMTIAAVLCTVFHVCIYFATSPGLLYAASILFGVSTILGGFGLCLAVVSWWAGKNAGKATSLLSVGVGLVTTVAAPVVAGCIETYGPRNTALVQGLICGGIMLFAAWFLVSEHPSNYSQEYAPETGEQTDHALDGMAMKDILRTVPFWAVFLAIALFNLTISGFVNNAASLYQTMGVDAVNAAFGISAYNIAQSLWAFAFGTAVDKYGPGLVVSVCAVVGAVTMVLASMLSDMSGVLLVACMVASMSIGGNIGAVTYPKLFGSRETGTLVGLASAASSIGGMFGAPVAAFMYDASGSYDPYLYLATGISLLCAFLIMFSAKRKPVLQQK